MTVPEDLHGARKRVHASGVAILDRSGSSAGGHVCGGRMHVFIPLLLLLRLRARIYWALDTDRGRSVPFRCATSITALICCVID